MLEARQLSFEARFISAAATPESNWLTQLVQYANETEPDAVMEVRGQLVVKQNRFMPLLAEFLETT